MARQKKDSTTEKPVKGVKYSEIAPKVGTLHNRKKYLYFLEIYHYLRPYLSEESPRRIKDITRGDLFKRYPLYKQLVDDVWTCVFELKLQYPEDMVDRLFEEVEVIDEE